MSELIQKSDQPVNKLLINVKIWKAMYRRKVKKNAN